MTAANLNGRDLDRACAMAMGWHYVNDTYHGWEGWVAPVDDGRMHDDTPDYSTDPATLDEKLRWLRAIFTLAEIGVYKDGEVWARGAFDDVDTIDMESSGNTIHEATARLVVAVAEARAKEKHP